MEDNVKLLGVGADGMCGMEFTENKVNVRRWLFIYSDKRMIRSFVE
ncbi:hypothetical protein IGA_04675 [Bacillus cereus HuA3-9]|uniref:Uncharacterized protein n=1 Tax=Bacillus cereus HuA3-9 TaxID=1053205 RepID=R8CQB5_BACCE|nr:hypothetical protein IGA_04675 [Bacillus cereus HuA3-9]